MEQTAKTNIQVFLLLIVALILFTLDKLGTIGVVREITVLPLEYIQLPVFGVKNNLTSRVEFLLNLAQIEKENIALAEKLVEISAENAKLQSLAAENEALRAQLGTFGGQVKSVPAKVVGTSRFLIIMPETKEVVKVGSTVTFGGNFVGVVVETGAKLVKVRLPQDPVSSIPAVIPAPSGKVLANLTGRYGKTQVLEKVEKHEIVPQGSIVQTAGDENIMPGLVLGKVVNVEKKDLEPFLSIEVQSLVDFSRLTTVFVLD